MLADACMYATSFCVLTKMSGLKMKLSVIVTNHICIQEIH